MARAVGIDIGTTNSVICVLEGGEPTVVRTRRAPGTTPSVVAFAKNGEVLVGQSAKNLWGSRSWPLMMSSGFMLPVRTR